MTQPEHNAGVMLAITLRPMRISDPDSTVEILLPDGRTIEVQLLRSHNDRAKLAFRAPRDIVILRAKLRRKADDAV